MQYMMLVYSGRAGVGARRSARRAIAESTQLAQELQRKRADSWRPRRCTRRRPPPVCGCATGKRLVTDGRLRRRANSWAATFLVDARTIWTRPSRLPRGFPWRAAARSKSGRWWSWRPAAGSRLAAARLCGSRRNKFMAKKDERSTGSGGHAQGRVRSDVGRQAREVGCQRPAFCGLGNLSREGIAGGSEPAVCVAIQRLVRAADSALQRWRQDLGAGG